MAERLFLVGMMGAGKSATGTALAELLGWSHLDADAEIERATAMTPSELFAAHGEPRFRQVERDVIAAAARDSERVVVSAGGGAVIDPANRAVMNDSGTVVWLRARVDTLASRVGSAPDRPVLAMAPEGDVTAALARLEAERRPMYEMVADVVVDVDGLAVADVARRVLEELGR